MAITPDTKDWTWVVERRCPQCGYDPAAVDIADLPDLLLCNAARWLRVLRRPDVEVRPDEVTWSALEYAAHVRDVHRVMRDRLSLMLTRDEPALPSWDQDEAAVADRYSQQDPAVVAEQLVAAAGQAAAGYSRVRPEQLGRGGVRSDGAGFTVRTLGLYHAHEPVHHLWDVSG